MNYKDYYKNKKVLITGHTGFKGTWLSIWLSKLGANVIGFSKDIPTTPSMFEVLEVEKKNKTFYWRYTRFRFVTICY